MGVGALSPRVARQALGPALSAAPCMPLPCPASVAARASPVHPARTAPAPGLQEAAAAGLLGKPLTAKNVEEMLGNLGLPAEFATHSQVRASSAVATRSRVAVQLEAGTSAAAVLLVHCLTAPLPPPQPLPSRALLRRSAACLAARR